MTRTALTAATLSLTSGIAAQDMVVEIRTTTDPELYVIQAIYNGALPAGTTAIGALWADSSFTLSGDAPIRYVGFNPGYRSSLFGDPVIIGDGTDSTSFAGIQPPEPLGAPDGSNPLLVTAFRYSGSILSLGMDFVGQNSAFFVGNPDEPFGTFQLYQFANGDPGQLSFRIDFPRLNQVPLDPSVIDFFVPTPATLALAPVALVAAHRRRRSASALA